MSGWRVLSNGLWLKSDAGEKLPIARGHVFSTFKPLFIETACDKKRTIVAYSKHSGHRAIVYPRFQKIFHKANAKYLAYVAVSPEELHEIQQLLNEEHYQKSPTRGTYLGVRELSRNGEPLVGAAVASEVYYTMPQERNDMVVESFGIDWYKRLQAGLLRRNDIINGCKITCGTRFALRKCARHKCLSEHLASLLAEVCANHRWPNSDYIEVMRKMSAGRLSDLLAQKRNDFLVRSGYVPVIPYSWRTTDGFTTRAAQSTIVSALYIRDLRQIGKSQKRR